MANSPTGPSAKIDRANMHFQELKSAVSSFCDSIEQHEIVVIEPNADGMVSYVFRPTRKVPSLIPCIFGDLIHNLRSALDILLSDLILNNGEQVTNKDYFPIGRNTHEFNSAFGGIKTRLSHRTREEMERLHPDKTRVQDHLWAINQLDIADKHHLLLTAVATTTAMDLSAINPDHIRLVFTFPDGKRELAPAPPIMQWPVGVPCHGDGDVLIGPLPPLKDQNQIRFVPDIAITEPGVIERQPILKVAQQCFEVVDAVVHGFDSVFV